MSTERSAADEFNESAIKAQIAMPYQRLLSLCHEFGVTDADTLKHRLEDHARWRRDIIDIEALLTYARMQYALISDESAEGDAHQEGRKDAYGSIIAWFDARTR